MGGAELRIGIDGRPLQTGSKYRGIGSYTYNLIKSLTSIDSGNRYIVFGFRKRDFPMLEGWNVEFAPVLREFGVARLYWIWESIFMNRILSRYGLDLFHVTQPCCITGAPPCRVVSTVHDLIPLIMGRKKYFGYLQLDKQFGYGRQLRTFLIADGIITYSRAAAENVIRLLNIPEGKIVVSPIGPDDFFKPVSDPLITGKRKLKYGIKKDYILFFGIPEGRKNLFRLLRVFPEVRSRCGDIDFVIVSEIPKKHQRKLLSLAKDLHIERSVHVLGYIPLPDLVAIMNGAAMLAFPSTYEGFGLPVLEAMACGTPVLTSNVSSLPEVAGDAAVLVDPYSDEEVKNGVIRILSDEGLRRELREKGLERAKLFSWKRHAEDVLRIYREVAG